MDGLDLSLHTRVHGCEIACLILSSTSQSVTTKIQPLFLSHWAPPRSMHSLMCRPSNPCAKQYTTYRERVMCARQCTEWEKDTHKLTCLPLPGQITQSGVKWWTFLSGCCPIPLLSSSSLLCLNSHPWHVMIKWLLLEFSEWPVLQKASTLSYLSSSYILSITPQPFPHQEILSFLFDSGWIVSISFQFMGTPKPHPTPLYTPNGALWGCCKIEPWAWEL